MSRKKPSFPLPGPRSLLAAGGACALLATPAAALELAAINVDSALGQPLRASIAFALGPNEQISSQCVYLNAGSPGAGLPAITRASATIRGNRILLRGDTPLREPMMSLSLSVDCPYTARLQRDFLLMLNPPAIADEAPAPLVRRESDAPAAQPVRRPVDVFEPAARPARAAPADTTPIAAGARYRVQAGDTLSEIVSRIENRRLALWPAVDAVFAANPQAFAGGSIDRIIAGATIEIPAGLGEGIAPAATVADAEPGSSPAVVESDSGARAYGGAREGVRERTADPLRIDLLDNAPSAASVPATAEPAIAAEPMPQDVIAAQDAIDATAEVELAPGTSAAPAAAEPVIDIPDTRIEQPVSEPIPLGSANDGNPAQSWLVWLGGSGVAIFLALLLFGRRLRERFGGAQALPINDSLAETQVNEELHNRRSSDRGEPAPEPGIDLAELDEVSESAPEADTAGAAALDFDFAASGEYSEELDFVVGEDDGEARQPRTRIMPARKAELDEQTGNYDMSMVLDVTKQDFGGDRKPRDLQAIEVETLDSRPRKGPALDLTTEFDYAILEQDYEEELTATQKLDRDIEAAARELQRNLDEFNEDSSQISMAEDLDGTAEVKAEIVTGDVPAENEALTDLDDTDVNASITAELRDSDETVEMIDADTVEMGDADATVERPVAGSAERRKKTG